MVETELTLKAFACAKEHFAGKIDECGKPVMDRLLCVAERMDDEVTTCAAFLQDVVSDSIIDSAKLLADYPRIIADLAYSVHFDAELFFDYLDDPYDVFIRGVITNKYAKKVVLEDLRYRVDLKNYAELTASLSNRIQVYKKAINHIENSKEK